MARNDDLRGGPIVRSVKPLFRTQRYVDLRRGLVDESRRRLDEREAERAPRAFGQHGGDKLDYVVMTASKTWDPVSLGKAEVISGVLQNGGTDSTTITVVGARTDGSCVAYASLSTLTLALAQRVMMQATIVNNDEVTVTVRNLHNANQDIANGVLRVVVIKF